MRKEIVYPLLVAGMLAFGKKLFALKQTGDLIEIKPVGIKWNKGGSWLSSYISLYIKLLNPTQNAVKVDKVVGAIYYGSTLIASYTSPHSVNILPGNENNMTLNFKVSNEAAIDALMQRAVQKQIKDIVVKYVLHIGPLKIPQSYTYKTSELL